MTHADSDQSGPTFTLVQISDLHLKPGDQDRQTRADEIIQMALDQKPDVVVLSGDLSEDGYDHASELSWAKDQIVSLASQPFPLFILPGNHDVGNKSGQGPNAINAERLANWNNILGSDHFVHELGGWLLIGLNSLLIASDLPEEKTQLAWLDQLLEQAAMVKQNVAIFMHEPPFLKEPGQSTNDRSDYWPIETSKQLLYIERFNRPQVKLVANGHVHAYQSTERHNVSHVWCPSPAFIIRDCHFAQGSEVTGLVVHTLGPDGASHRLIPYDKPDTRVVPFNPAASVTP